MTFWTIYEVIAVACCISFLEGGYKKFSSEEKKDWLSYTTLFLFVIYGLIVTQIWPITLLYLVFKEKQ